MHKHLLYIALAHVIVLMFSLHWPMDHVCIGLAYGLAWSHAEMPNEYDRLLQWVSQKTVQQTCARLRVLYLRLTSSRLRFRMTLTVEGMQVRVNLQAALAPRVATE